MSTIAHHSIVITPPSLPTDTTTNHTHQKALIFVIDPWDNAVLKSEPSLNKNFANIDLFDRVPFYPTFLRNAWPLAAAPNKDPRDPHRLVGVVPMRCVRRRRFWGMSVGGSGGRVVSFPILELVPTDPPSNQPQPTTNPPALTPQTQKQKQTTQPLDSMGFEEGLKLLQELGARPDALYWEGFPHEEQVLATLRLVNEVREEWWCGCVYVRTRKR